MVMIRPEKVVIPKFDTDEILIIDLATTQKSSIPFKLISKKIDIFYFPESDLLCIQ